MVVVSIDQMGLRKIGCLSNGIIYWCTVRAVIRYSRELIALFYFSATALMHATRGGDQLMLSVPLGCQGNAPNS